MNKIITKRKYEIKNFSFKCKLITLFFILHIITLKNFFIVNINKLLALFTNHEFVNFLHSNENIKKSYKVVAISYSNDLYQKQLRLNKKSALEVGKVDEYYSYGPYDLDNEFKQKNKDILSRKRGNGYWLWKPYIINKTITEKLNEGDYLIYTDAGTLFMDSTLSVINFLIKNNASMWMNKLTHLESKYSKRDAFILMGVDTPFYSQTYQYSATIQIYKKSYYSIKFIQDWLYYCQDKRIITDENNVLGKPNYENFKDNRHDQTVLSLLIKKYRIANSNTKHHIIMPNIICIYRRMKFKNYNDLKQKCKMMVIEQINHYS